jgi:hypothetical protein
MLHTHEGVIQYFRFWTSQSGLDIGIPCLFLGKKSEIVECLGDDNSVRSALVQFAHSEQRTYQRTHPLSLCHILKEKQGRYHCRCLLDSFLNKSTQKDR